MKLRIKCSALLVLPELKLKNDLPLIALPSARILLNPMLSAALLFVNKLLFTLTNNSTTICPY
jgi:hypothetical protein